MKKMISILIISLLLFTFTTTAFSQSTPSAKEEVVYGILEHDGNVGSLYVVNIFTGGPVTDYGTYTEIRNMTGSEKIVQNEDQITVSAASDRFSYQGTLDKKELPWIFKIKYFIDGREISAGELAGKSGSLRIEISVKRNANFNRIFFDNYALQISVPLSSKLCSNIKSDGATIAEAGGKKQLTYTVLPGSGADISLTADVHDFEMEAITINGIKMSFDISIDTDEFTGQISELTDAINELDSGAGSLLGGAEQLAEGMQKYTDGLKAFKEGLDQLPDGTVRLDAGAASLKNGLDELAKQNDALSAGASAIQQATFDAVNARLAEYGLKLPELTPDNYSSVLSSIPQLAEVKSQLDGTVQFTQGLNRYLQGVAQLDQGAAELSKGISEFSASSSLMAQSANELYNAASELNGAVRKLRDGLVSYKEGTKRFRDGTAGIDLQIEKRIDEVLETISGDGGKIVSFVSEKNTNVSAVQFVLKTSPVKVPDVESTPAPEPVRLTFWQKLLKLFGLYK